jgi:hypothetical protein
MIREYDFEFRAPESLCSMQGIWRRPYHERNDRTFLVDLERKRRYDNIAVLLLLGNRNNALQII